MLENFEVGKPPRWVTPQKQSGWSGRAMVVWGWVTLKWDE